MKKANLAGTWKLLSAIASSSNGDSFHFFGDNPFGRLMYDTNGNMSVFIMKTGRLKFASNDRMRGSVKEIKEAFEGTSAYCGTFEIDEDKGTVAHYIEGDIFPNWEGTVQVRFYELSGNQLTLNTTPVLIKGKELIVSLIWERKN